MVVSWGIDKFTKSLGVIQWIMQVNRLRYLAAPCCKHYPRVRRIFQLTVNWAWTLEDTRLSSAIYINFISFLLDLLHKSGIDRLTQPLIHCNRIDDRLASKLTSNINRVDWWHHVDDAAQSAIGHHLTLRLLKKPDRWLLEGRLPQFVLLFGNEIHLKNGASELSRIKFVWAFLNSCKQFIDPGQIIGLVQVLEQVEEPLILVIIRYDKLFHLGLIRLILI